MSTRYKVENWLICWLDNIVYYQCDVSKWEEVEVVSQKIFTEVSSLSLAMGIVQCFLQIGEPTILINNAGIVQGKLVIDLSVEDVQQYVVCVYPVTSFSQFIFQNVWCKHFLSFLDFKGLPSCDVKEKVRSYCRPSLITMFTLLNNSTSSRYPCHLRSV